MFWDYLSTFWNNLADRDVWENYWDGLNKMSSNLIGKANRFKDVTAMTNGYDINDYYDIKIGVLSAKPTDLDPTNQNSNNIIKPIGTLVLEPVNGVFNDFIEISADDYYRIRDIGINQYVVIGDKYFKINNLMSSEEPEGRPCSIEINESVSVVTGLDFGKFGIRANSDVSDFLVFIQEGVTSSVTWHTGGIEIIVAAGDTVEDIIALANTGTRWGDLYNKSTHPDVPILNEAGELYIDKAQKFSTFPLFVEYEEANGRFYPPGAKVWHYYDGLTGDDDGYYTYEKLKYMIKIDGSLQYLGDQPFNFYLTNAKLYQIDENVIDLPSISNYIDKSEDGITLVKDVDYLFYNNTLELLNDIEIDDTFYCKIAPIIDDYLYEMWGTLVNNSRFKDYNYNNVSGKVAIHGLIGFNQNLDSMEKALNVYYGLPIAPERCRVIGLYESFGYEIIEIDGNNVTLKIDRPLHPFIDLQSEMMNENVGNIVIIEMVNRSLGIIKLASVTGLSVGDKLYLKLENRNKIVSYDTESITVETSTTMNHLAHLITMMYRNKRYPEVLVYNSEINGIYHITAFTEPSSQKTKLTIYKPTPGETLYNDYIASSNSNVNAGFLHLLWPTHKFLYLQLESGTMYKAYLDAPIDTIYDTYDELQQYDIIARNVSMKKFNGWEEFNYFRRQSGVNSEADLVELISAIPGAEFGKYFPSEYSTNRYYI